jgi:hypothetical protein
VPWLQGWIYVEDGAVPTDHPGNAEPQSEEWLNASEAARRLGCSDTSVKTLARNGFLRSARRLGKVVYSAESVALRVAELAHHNHARAKQRSGKLSRLNGSGP